VSGLRTLEDRVTGERGPPETSGGTSTGAVSPLRQSQSLLSDVLACDPPGASAANHSANTTLFRF